MVCTLIFSTVAATTTTPFANSLTPQSWILRPSRKTSLSIVSGATVLKIRTQVQALPPGIADLPIELPGPDESMVEPANHAGSPFTKCISMRAARGRFGMVGPGAIWFRVDRPLIEGSPVSQVMRAVVAADFSNGTSSVLDFRQWTFINADLSVNFARQPVGEWVLVDGECWVGPDGAGLAMSRLADEHGYFGRAVQSLVIEKR